MVYGAHIIRVARNKLFINTKAKNIYIAGIRLSADMFLTELHTLTREVVLEHRHPTHVLDTRVGENECCIPTLTNNATKLLEPPKKTTVFLVNINLMCIMF